jgi:hypothetical protein
VQLVQWETYGKVWRLHFLPAGTTCTAQLSSIEPAVDVDFDTGGQSKVPLTGTTIPNIGVGFYPEHRPDIGAFTANSGVTLTFTHVDSAPGNRWTGHLKVDELTFNSDKYSFEGPIDAKVCPPG